MFRIVVSFSFDVVSRTVSVVVRAIISTRRWGM